MLLLTQAHSRRVSAKLTNHPILISKHHKYHTQSLRDNEKEKKNASDVSEP
jgi:hypothetical protein